ncbi:uncharacterized protein LOC117173431 isoform X2 [Belonocnema kinseyi]|nr:uncharacterized protein LOC117173431 isoform X2 [Belonocnema kinseyi]XP_033217885.1 uncharacterized protein LOC117173431 isoform X2 [Belonocnema kinseyi]
MKPLQVQNRPNNCHTSSVRIKNDSPSEIEGDEDFASEPDDSNDSWATTEEFSTDFILRYRNRGANRSLPTETSIDKPFACPVPGCKKRYKNVNGIKYHSKNGHKNDGKIIRKAFKCPCGKNYKTQYGLKNHVNVHHGNSLSNLKILRSEMEIDQEETTLAEEIKFPAMEDHVYVKQNRSMERDCESLGILTPASTPPFSTQSPTKIGSTVYDRQVRSYHNYFTVQNSDRDYNN